MSNDAFNAMRKLATTLGVSAPESNDDILEATFINSINRAVNRALKVVGDDIQHGDIVTYERCFGDSELIFVGMSESLAYNNDCVLILDNHPVPACFVDVKKVKNTQ